jgi:hypothetical protein
MRSSKLTILLSTTTLLAAACVSAACSSDSASAPPGGSGATSSGGNTSQGGELTPADAVITGSVTQCSGTTAAQLPDTTVSECVRDACSNAACVPQNLITQFVSASTDLSLLAECEPGVLCVPIDFIATTGDFQTKNCQSLLGAEGRCISTCIPLVGERVGQLPQADCAQGELCAPCYDPITGDDTQACNQGCDTGPTQAPVTFARCGNDDLGVCVPSNLVPPELAPLVPQDTCAAGELCAPELKAVDINANFQECTPTSDILTQINPPPGPNGQLGGCVPAYLVDAQEPAPPEGAVLQDGCAAGELCAPCNNPLNNNEPTGACPFE